MGNIQFGYRLGVVHPKLDREVAIETLPEEWAQVADRLERFERPRYMVNSIFDISAGFLSCSRRRSISRSISSLPRVREASD